jgi:hypothetical protein
MRCPVCSELVSAFVEVNSNNGWLCFLREKGAILKEEAISRL